MTKWNANWVNFLTLMLMSASLMLSGCVMPLFGGYGANGQSREEFTRYVESVFRLQNSITSEIMALQESDATDRKQADFVALKNLSQKLGALSQQLTRQY